MLFFLAEASVGCQSSRKRIKLTPPMEQMEVTTEYDPGIVPSDCTVCNNISSVNWNTDLQH